MLVHRHSSIQPNVGLAEFSGVAKVFYHLRFRFYAAPIVPCLEWLAPASLSCARREDDVTWKSSTSR